MGFTVVALAAGLLLGFATGGRPSNVRRRPLQLLSVLAISALLQVIAQRVDLPDAVGLAMILVSYVGLTAFALANIRVVGMFVVLVGLLCNLAVIAANGGMPVRRSAILAAHTYTAAQIAGIDFGAKRHLATDDDTLRILGDIIPVRPSREVLSFGDLILAFGIADVVFRLLRPAEMGKRRRDDHLVDLTEAAQPAHADTLVTA